MLTKTEQAEMTRQHNAKYDAFIDEIPGGQAAVREYIAQDNAQLRRAHQTNKHFNNIPLALWDGWARRVWIANKRLTLCEQVCILKRVAELQVIKTC